MVAATHGEHRLTWQWTFRGRGRLGTHLGHSSGAVSGNPLDLQSKARRLACQRIELSTLVSSFWSISISWLLFEPKDWVMAMTVSWSYQSQQLGRFLFSLLAGGLNDGELTPNRSSCGLDFVRKLWVVGHFL